MSPLPQRRARQVRFQKSWLWLLVPISLVFAAVAGAQPSNLVEITRIDFNSDVPGQPPATGGFNQPTSVDITPGTTALVQSSGNGINTQPVVLTADASSKYASVNREFAHVASGPLRVEATVAFDRLFWGFFLGTAATAQSTVATRLIVTSAGEIQDDFTRTTVGHYTANRPFRVRMDIDMTAKTWSVTIDDGPVVSSLPFENPPSVVHFVGAVTAGLSVFPVTAAGASVSYDDIAVFVPVALGLAPATAVNPGGIDHTVVATLTTNTGVQRPTPVQGSTVTFQVISGPNQGVMGQAMTDANGQATFTYQGNGRLGTDQVRASVGALTSNIATKIWVASPAMLPGFPADYFGDGKTDLAVYNPSTGIWHIMNPSILAERTQQWGAPGDIPVPGDYDGDGKADITAYRPSNGVWFIIQSSNQVVRIVQWGAPGDVPMPADYDGDGKTDIAVYRPSTGEWFIINSATATVTVQQWGAPTEDRPVPGDYDGDGKADIAVYRPSTGEWFIINSGTDTVTVQQWGAPDDFPVPGDYDGDGKTDIAVYRPSTGFWYVINSSTHTVTAQQWGAPNDGPVPGDYDGDGKTDIAVYRPSTGFWYVINSATSTVTVQQWGAQGDQPLPEWLP